MPLARRSSAPADVSAEFCAGVGAVDDEARAGKRLEQRRQRRVADPIVCPSDPPTQRQHGIGVDRQHPVEARAQLASGVGRVAAIEGKCKAVRDGAGLGVTGRVEALRLDRGVGGDPASVALIAGVGAISRSV